MGVVALMSYWYSEDDVRLCGDFYNEDDVYRSADPMKWWDIESSSKSIRFDLPFPLFPEHDIKCGNFHLDMQTTQTVQKFVAGGEAPEVPKDNFFALADTTVEVRDRTADCLGNWLIDIFNAEHAMHIIKTSLNKFAIKAESTHPAWFVLKARIYSKASLHIVEFQRKKGDVVAFCQFFHKVMVLLKDKHNPTTEKCDSMLSHLIRAETSVQPFIDMANNTSDPLLLAEAASGLANAAVEEQKVLELCVPDAFTAFKTILRAGGYSALCPLAQLLSQLAMTMEASPFFADTDFWEILLDVVVAEGTCGELRTQYAFVARSALALGASKEQMCVLKAAANAKGISEQVRQMLEEAAHMADLTGGGCLHGRFGLAP